MKTKLPLVLLSAGLLLIQSCNKDNSMVPELSNDKKTKMQREPNTFDSDGTDGFPAMEAFRTKIKERLLSEEGIKLRKKRAIEPEAVFGQLKSNNRSIGLNSAHFLK